MQDLLLAPLVKIPALKDGGLPKGSAPRTESGPVKNQSVLDWTPLPNHKYFQPRFFRGVRPVFSTGSRFLDNCWLKTCFCALCSRCTVDRWESKKLPNYKTTPIQAAQEKGPPRHLAKMHEGSRSLRLCSRGRFQDHLLL